MCRFFFFSVRPRKSQSFSLSNTSALVSMDSDSRHVLGIVCSNSDRWRQRTTEVPAASDFMGWLELLNEKNNAVLLGEVTV